MEKTGNYFVDRNNANNLKLKELLQKLPDFCTDYFIGIESRTTPLTRINYAIDLKIFFEYLVNEIPQFMGKNMVDLTFSPDQKSNFDLSAFVLHLNSAVLTGTFDGTFFIFDDEQVNIKNLCGFGFNIRLRL